MPEEEGEEDFEADFEEFEETGESEVELSDDEAKPFPALRSGSVIGKGVKDLGCFGWFLRAKDWRFLGPVRIKIGFLCYWFGDS